MSNWITIEDSLKGRAAAIKRERERLINLLMENNVLRRDGIVGAYVYINCNTMEVLYLKDTLVEGSNA